MLELMHVRPLPRRITVHLVLLLWYDTSNMTCHTEGQTAGKLKKFEEDEVL